MQKSYIIVKALIKNKKSFLILKTKDSDKKNELSGWETPGGHLEIGEEIINGLKREIKEETNLITKILFPFNVYSANANKKNSVIGINYLVKYRSGKVKIDDNEHSKYKWANISDIRKLKNSIGLQKEINAYVSFLKLNK